MKAQTTRYTKADMLECYKAANTVWSKDQMESLEAEFNEWLEDWQANKETLQSTDS